MLYGDLDLSSIDAMFVSMLHSVNYKKLSEVARIRTGYTFRSKIGSDRSEDGIPVLQPKDIKSDIEPSELVRVASADVNQYSTHALKVGEILMANKGVKFSTLIIDETFIGTIASSSFFVISPDVSEISPEFLNWYLSQEEAMSYLKSNVTGSTIPSLTKRALESLPVPLPSFKVQKGIVEMQSLVRDEEGELLNLIEMRKEFLRSYAYELMQAP